MSVRALRCLGLPLLCLLVACNDASGSGDAGPVDGSSNGGSGNDGGPDGASQDGEAGDASDDASDGAPPSDPPEIRSVGVNVQGALPVMVDLTSDARWVMADPAPARFTILARDDVDDSQDLEVAVVDTLSGDELAAATQTFESGLWLVDVTVEPGTRLVVQLRDSSDNTTISDHGLLLPTQAEALVGTWQQRDYDSSQTVTARTDLDFGADAHFQRSGPGPSDLETGTYQVQNGQLDMERRTLSGGDQAPETVEETRVGAFYVDLSFLSAAPYLRDGDGSDIEDTWTRSWTTDQGAGVVQHGETLVLDTDGNFSHETREDTTTTLEEGTYVVQPADSYTESFGNFLVFTVTSMDGSPVSPTTRTELYNLRAGRLLLSPYVSAE